MEDETKMIVAKAIQQVFDLLKNNIENLTEIGQHMDQLLPLITLVMQDIALQRVRADKGAITDADAAQIAASTARLQSMSLSYDLAIISCLVGYLIGTGHLEELLQAKTSVDKAIENRAKEN